MTARVGPPVFEHHRRALGIGDPAPRISWSVSADDDWVGSRAEIECRTEGRRLSSVLDLDDSVLVPWPFPALESRQSALVRVRLCSAYGDWSEWSEFSPVEVGLLHPTDWTAIGVGAPEGMVAETPRPVTLLRGAITLNRPPVRARVYASAHGIFELEMNGHKVGDEVLAPGWTSYGHRIAYYTYDVTGLVREGENVMGAWLADGWFRGRLGFGGGYVDNYGTHTALIAQLVVDHADGSTTTFGTDESWTAAASPIVASGLLEGERYDARLETAGWSSVGQPGTGWVPVEARPFETERLFAPLGPGIRCTEEIAPVTVDRKLDGRLILDFGQNLVGRLRIAVNAPAGQVVRIRHAEVLQGGELNRRPLRGATSTDEYIARGDRGEELWEPRFTVHGFRYVEITGWAGRPVEQAVVARVIHTDMARTGWFSCSDPLLNRLHENVVWSMRGNFVGLPTDCPQRDERLGWTGDIQIFAPTATFLFDCSGLLSSWLRDVAREQHPDGTVPWYVPSIPGGPQWTPARPGAGWGDVAVLTPWDVYQSTADRQVLTDQLASARAWVDLVARLAGPNGVWDSGYQLGDWLDPSAPPDDPAAGSTDRYLVASAYFARSAKGLSDMTALLSTPDADQRKTLAALARDGFRRRYRGASGRLVAESQTAYAMAIVFGLFDDDEFPEAGARLAELVTSAGVRLTTGFLGTPLVLDALTMTGHRSLAHELLQQRELPSWLWPVTQGATTMWERWDSQLPDGTVNPGDMTSFNHYAFGSVADWMHREVAGLTSLAPGWRRIRFRPGVESGLQWATARHLSSRGEVSMRWQISDRGLDVAVTIPVGATGVLEFPGGEAIELGAGSHRVRRDGPESPDERL